MKPKFLLFNIIINTALEHSLSSLSLLQALLRQINNALAPSEIKHGQKITKQDSSWKGSDLIILENNN